MKSIYYFNHTPDHKVKQKLLYPKQNGGKGQILEAIKKKHLHFLRHAKPKKKRRDIGDLPNNIRTKHSNAFHQTPHVHARARFKNNSNKPGLN